MQNFVRRTALAVLVPAAALGLALGTASAATAATSTATLESQVVSLTNAERVKAGCGRLAVSKPLGKAADAHSADMAKKGYFSHTGANGSRFTERVKRAGFAGQAYGENIAWGYKDAKGVMRGWMNSPGHRKNILNCKSKTIGVGAARNSGGVLYWTQEFGR